MPLRYNNLKVKEWESWLGISPAWVGLGGVLPPAPLVHIAPVFPAGIKGTYSIYERAGSRCMDFYKLDDLHRLSFVVFLLTPSC